jgi:hypothetical protein
MEGFDGTNNYCSAEALSLHAISKVSENGQRSCGKKWGELWGVWGNMLLNAASANYFWSWKDRENTHQNSRESSFE